MTCSLAYYKKKYTKRKRGHEMEQKKGGFLKGLVLGIVLAAVVVVGVTYVQRMNQGDITPTSELTKKKIELIEGLIDENYLDEVDQTKMTDEMLKGLMNGLGDDYAAYYTADEYKEIMNSTQGDYRGVGMIMQQYADTKEVLIVGVYEGTPAETAGIKAGDILEEVDDMVCTENDLNVIAAAIKNGEGDTVHMKLRRDKEEYEVDVEKAEIEVPVVGGKMLDDQIGYIQIAQFTGLTSDQFAEQYKELTDQGMKALIVDLRNNPGGLLDSVVDTLRQILPEGMIVYTQTKDGTKKEYTCDGETPIEIPLTVLVNENSASASEIFAGAVHDHEIATLVGTKTFGKGIVQQTFPFTDGSAIKMTIAKYYTPNGVCIHGEGISPDVEVELPEDATEDVQLNRAIEVAKEKISDTQAE